MSKSREDLEKAIKAYIKDQLIEANETFDEPLFTDEKATICSNSERADEIIEAAINTIRDETFEYLIQE